MHKPWSVFHRTQKNDGSHRYKKFDDGSIGFVPHCHTRDVNGVVSYLCARRVDCQRAVDWLNAHYPIPDIEFMRENWESIVGELSLHCVQW